jgi:hypothetical protein
VDRIELDFLVPPERTVCIDGKDITISPIRMRTLPKLLRVVEPVFAQLLGLVDTPSVDAAVRLLGDRGDVISEVVSLCTGLKVDEVGDMLPDRVAALLLVCCEVNADFFARAVPAMTAQADRLAPQLAAKLASLTQPQSDSAGTPKP